MSGKGELVSYTKLFKKGPLKKADKEDLKKKINTLIDNTTQNITIEAMVKADN
jgi:hypothetical protein